MFTRGYSPVSRYKVDSNGITSTRIPALPSRAFLYTVRQGDTLESIAARQLGDSLRYWEIADINPQIRFPLSVQVGDIIRIPL